MQTQGWHLALDMWFACDLEESRFDDLFDLIRLRFNVLQEVRQQFTPSGLTMIFILSESHVSLHTYPEERYASLDVYICTDLVNLTSFLE